MNKKSIIFTACFFSLIYCYQTYGSEKKGIYRPTSTPFIVRPYQKGDSPYGIGYTQIKLTADWEDNFFNKTVEKVGKVDYTAHNLVFAFLKTKEEAFFSEIDINLGIITAEEKTKTFSSTVVSKDVDVDYDGKGFDLGARFVISRNIYKHKCNDKEFLDLNFSFSFQAAFIHLNNTITGESQDKLDKNNYEEVAYGAFLRPFIMLQPFVTLSDHISVVPFIGLGTKLSLLYYFWEDQEFRRNGIQGSNTDDDGVNLEFSGAEPIFGFDVLIKPMKDSDSQIGLGGVISKVIGDSEADFKEFHILYSFNF